MNKHSNLIKVSKALSDRKISEHQRAADRVDAVYQSLHELEALSQQAYFHNLDGGGAEMSGVESNWRGWLARKKSELNQQLAMELAIKEDALASARIAFSKNDALEKIVEKQRQKVRLEAQAKRNQALENLFSCRNF